jgi:hypothetical protein
MMKSPAILATLATLMYVILLTSAAVGIRSIYKVATGSTGAAASASARANCLPSQDGFLQARIRGANGAGNVDIDWRDTDMQCDGGLRPDERGFRLTFVGRLSRDGQHIRLVFGIASSADETSARNVPTNVTIILEDEQKLYSTASEGKCTIDDLSLQPQGASRDGWRRVVARGFCTVPVSAMRGEDALLVDRFDFAGGLRDEDTR